MRTIRRISLAFLSIAVGILVVWAIDNLFFPTPVDEPASRPVPTHDPGTSGAVRKLVSSPPHKQTLSQIRDVIIATDSMNQPLDFWGIVVDQFDTPIADARVDCVIEYWPIFSAIAYNQPAKKTISEHTDARGAFSITGKSGHALLINGFTKTGYSSVAGNQMIFGPGDSATDNQNASSPHKFVLWKQSGVKIDYVRTRITNVRLPVDGQPIYFDLFHGKGGVEKLGQLKITFTRDPEILLHSGIKHSWKLVLEILKGGLQQAPDDFHLIAPLDGYESSLDYSMDKEDEDWAPAFEETFYIKLSKLTYGKLHVRFLTYGRKPPIGISISSVINPMNSRSLEEDFK